MEDQSPPLDRALLGERVRHFRIQQGLTQAELADKAGVSITTLYQIESGGPSRLSSIEKVCWVGLKTQYAALLHTRAKLERESYLIFRASETSWYARGDRRKSIPEDNAMRLQDPAERQRLGRLGFVAAFHHNPNILMADGPGTLFIELHGRVEGSINSGVYRDCKLYCQAGRVRCMVGEETLEMGPGDMAGFRDADLRWIEPADPIANDGPVPVVLWMGAVRVGKAVKDDGRTIVRKPREPLLP